MGSQYEGINWGVGEIVWMERATGQLADQLLAQAKTQTNEIYSWLSDRLGNKNFFNGDEFGFADVCETSSPFKIACMGPRD